MPEPRRRVLHASTEYAVWQIMDGGFRPTDTVTLLGPPAGAAGHPIAARPAKAPAAGRLSADPSPSPLPNIVTYYRKTRPLRLVITGAAGAGKTVLAGCAVRLTDTATSGLTNELAPDPGMSLRAPAVIRPDAMYGLVPQSRNRPADRQTGRRPLTLRQEGLGSL
ncbi:hypothetical protein SM007_28235 [Streptomyces avermitilis]|uniref:Uncharacterized protein n=1 Tax=Streptomyces avermitilis TaxID=33903 RepID=A0A4D4MFL7_STRAX|nr:hypothetical protein SM007_28235 [Streptomyces avermitilis]GDY68886.1 hypothetical protein SAV14893_082790 [Streptomyces avermitilis]GDY70730.1 hypothetical protein SAV31267_002150 [Streptomyces avermitilis]